MTESVEAQHIMLAAMAGALVVVFGAIHAFFLAFGKLRASRRCIRLSWVAYAAFMIATIILARTLNFSGFWFLVMVVMLLGYLFAPYGIWHLSVATHGKDHEHPVSPPSPPSEGGTDHE